MKTAALWTLLLACLALAAPKSFSSETNTYSTNLTINIPDGSASGLISTIHVPDNPGEVVEQIYLTLNIAVPAGEMGFSGDLYGYLQHGDNLAILLNRPGRGPGLPAGYNDNISFSVTFADNAANGDIHNYRIALNGSDTIPLTFPLTGLWQPDGRAIDPDTVLSSDPRNALLASFTGANASGDWTLFLSDMSGEGKHRLENWSLVLQTTIVPEPTTWALLATFGLFTLAQTRRRLRQ